MKKYDEKDGVWRTIGGRKVFIRNGQSLSSAMKESGKFKKKKETEEEKAKKINDTMNKRAEIIDRLDNETKDMNDYDKYNLAVSKLENEDYSSPTERQYWAGEVERYKKSNSQDRSFITDKDIPDKSLTAEERKASAEKELSRIREHDAEYNDEERYSKANEINKKETFDQAIQRIDKIEGFDAQKEAISKYMDETGISRETINNALAEKEYDRHLGREYDKRFGKNKVKSGNDYLPKESKILTAGTSNRKEVSNNIQAHILSYYDNPVDFMEQMDAMDWQPTRWHAGQELAKGGSYLIYNGDVSDYLNSLNINPKGKSFSPDRSFEVYSSLIGRESERLYNNLEKLFEQYKKEHKNSNATLDDFRKWFK